MASSIWTGDKKRIVIALLAATGALVLGYAAYKIGSGQQKESET